MNTRHAHSANTYIQVGTHTYEIMDCYICQDVLKLKVLGWGDGLVGKAQGPESLPRMNIQNEISKTSIILQGSFQGQRLS